MVQKLKTDLETLETGWKASCATLKETLPAELPLTGFEWILHLKAVRLITGTCRSLIFFRISKLMIYQPHYKDI